MPQTRAEPQSGRGRHLGWLAAAGAVLAVVALAVWLGQVNGRSASTGAAAGPAHDTSSPTTAPATRARWEPGAPRKVVIPRLGVSSRVVPVKAPNRTLVPPQDAQVLGWWADGARPGAARGSALVAGHTVHSGGGALDHLEDLQRDDTVTVRTDRGTIRYVVDSVEVYGKGELVQHAERLFSQDAPGRLVLLTCEDWDGTQYLSNVVVIATPARR